MKRWLLPLLLLCSPAYPQGGNFGSPQQSYIHLLANSSATGPQALWGGGIGVFMCVGTWGGATVTLEYIGPDGATLVVAGTATTLTANGGGVFYLPSTNIQAVISSSGATTSLTCSAGSVPAPNSSSLIDFEGPFA
jgi:hypothetical protein